MKSILLTVFVWGIFSNFSYAANGTYTCKPKFPQTYLAQQHIDRFNLKVDSSALTMSKMHFLTVGSPSGCGTNPPKTIVMNAQIPNRSRTEPMKSMDQFRPSPSSEMNRTCFVSFNFYLPKKADTKKNFTLLTVWSDTDGSFSSKGGDGFVCKQN